MPDTKARRTISIILSVAFGLLALDASVQVVLAALHRSDDPLTLTVLQAGIGLAAAATAWEAGVERDGRRRR